MRRFHLSKKKIKDLKKNLCLDFWVGNLEDSPKLEIMENERTIILADDEPAYFLYQKKYYPTVYLLLRYPLSKNFVTVDMGAVKHILNGANVFSPGIVDCDPHIEEGNCVYIRDKKYLKPIAVGIAAMPCQDMLMKKEGIAIKTLHYYGDKIFKI